MSIENKRTKTLLPGIDPEVKIHGRCRVQNPLPVFWTAGGIEVLTDSTELNIGVSTDYDLYEQWIRIEVDGFNMIRMMLPRGRSTIGVFRGMKPGIKRRVRLFREVQPMVDDENDILLIESVSGDGEFYPVPDRRYKIEFVGDSITSGEGLSGSRSFHEWNAVSFSTIGSYTELTADKLDADYRIISQSGWGVYCGWDNNPHNTVPKIYGQYCSVINGKYADKFYTHEEYDFTGWRPDAVVINLATNDEGSFNNAAWTDPDTGISYKQDMNDNGVSTGRFTQAVSDLIMQVRRYNKDSHIVWAYGVLSDKLRPYIEEAIDRYRKISGDERISYVSLPGLKSSWIGANEHPGRPAHEAAADVLSNELEKILSGK